MNKLVLNFALLAALSAGLNAHAQKKKEVINDSNTPLHLLQPDYQVGYGIVSAELYQQKTSKKTWTVS